MFSANDIARGKVWVISDTHFGHNNIVRFCKRPGFDAAGNHSYELHNKVLIENWYKTIGPNDIVIHFGDVGKGYDAIVKWGRGLPGKIYYIKGNHDKKDEIRACADLGWTRVSALEIITDSGIIRCTHYPQYILDGTKEAPVGNLHGHTHNSYASYISDSPYHVNLSVEDPFVNYSPVLLKNAIEKLKFADKKIDYQRLLKVAAIDKPWEKKIGKGQNPPYQTIDLRR